MKKKEFEAEIKRLEKIVKYDPIKVLEELDIKYNDLMNKMWKDMAIYGQGIFYIDPDEILYGKTKLKKVKKTKLGKLIG